nr:hypothetical protein [Candidatus Sigynarchaeota archaeon]
MSIISFFAGGYLLAPVFLGAFKKIVGRKLIFGIEDKERPKQFKGAFFKALTPAFMAIHIGLLLCNNSTIQGMIFLPFFLNFMDPVYLRVLTLTVLLPVVSTISLFLFAGPFFILDAGIVYTNKEQENVKNGMYPTEIQSVGGWYLNILKGFTGISILFDFTSVIIPYMLQVFSLPPLIILTNLSWPLMPFIIAFFMITAIIMQDKTVLARKKYVYKIAEKMGIRGPLEDPLRKNKP